MKDKLKNRKEKIESKEKGYDGDRIEIRKIE